MVTESKRAICTNLLDIYQFAGPASSIELARLLSNEVDWCLLRDAWACERTTDEDCEQSFAIVTQKEGLRKIFAVLESGDQQLSTADFDYILTLAVDFNINLGEVCWKDGDNFSTNLLSVNLGFPNRLHSLLEAGVRPFKSMLQRIVVRRLRHELEAVAIFIERGVVAIRQPPPHQPSLWWDTALYHSSYLVKVLVQHSKFDAYRVGEEFGWGALKTVMERLKWVRGSILLMINDFDNLNKVQLLNARNVERDLVETQLFLTWFYTREDERRARKRKATE